MSVCCDVYDEAVMSVLREKGALAMMNTLSLRSFLGDFTNSLQLKKTIRYARYVSK
jgi:hypothetical protein